MGTCCSSSNSPKKLAYRTETSNSLITQLLPTVSSHPKAYVFELRLLAIKDLNPFDRRYNNPFVEMKLKSPDEIGGEQLQRSSYKDSTFSPKWEPDEKFLFLISDDTPRNIVISVYSNTFSEPIPIADVLLRTKDHTCTTLTEKTLPLIDPQSGQQNGKIILKVQLKSIEQASATEEHTIYEYQRWDPVRLWSHNFLPTDPGKWSTVDGQNFGKEMHHVAPSLPEGWTEDKKWYYLSHDDDPDGWQYATDFISEKWTSKNSKGMFVRRRAWRREVISGKEVNVPRTNSVRRGRKLNEDD